MHDVVENFAGVDARDSHFWRAWRNAYPFITVGALWEAVAHLGIFPVQFFPPLETIGATFARLMASAFCRIMLSTRSCGSPPVLRWLLASASRRACSWAARAGRKIFCCRW
jgi:hypothetical protein